MYNKKWKIDFVIDHRELYSTDIVKRDKQKRENKELWKTNKRIPTTTNIS